MKITKWVLTPHAAQRVVERKISLDELEDLITNPDEVLLQGPKFILTKTFHKRTDNKVAAVILEKKGDSLWIVLTVMINFQIQKSMNFLMLL